MPLHRLIRILLLILLLPLASTEAAEWTRWNPQATAQVRRNDTPVLLLISAGYCQACRDVVKAGAGTDQFLPLVLDQMERPDLAAAYLAFAEGFNGAPVELPVAVALTPFLDPVAASGSVTPESLKDFVAELEANWSRERFLETALLVRRLSLDGWRPSVPATPGQRLREIYVKLLEGRFDDADSETLLRMSGTALYDQSEGGFHRAARDDAWTAPELEKLLSDQALAVLAYTAAWQITEEERFATVATATADLILHQFLNTETGLFLESLGSHKPEPDEPVLTSSTALAISALSRAGTVFGESSYSTAAETALQALMARNIVDDRLYASRTAEHPVPASMLDYALLVRALVDVYESSFNPDHLLDAFELQRAAAEGVEGDRVPEMLLDIAPDRALKPVVGVNLVQLGAASGEASWVELGRELSSVGADLHQVVILAGTREPTLSLLLEVSRETFRPHLMIVMMETTAERDVLSPLVRGVDQAKDCHAGMLGERSEWNGKIDCAPIAVLCREAACESAPIDPAVFRSRID